MVAAYWGYVGLMVLRVRRGAKGVSRVLIPRLRVEQLMWIIWWPLIATWIALPFVVASGRDWVPRILRPIDVLAELRERIGFWGVDFVSWGAAVAAVIALYLSIRCWRHMGRHWRMGIDPGQDLELLTDGPFSWVRHPIYTLGMLIMLCTAAIIPSAAFLTIAVVHIALLNLKSINEERFLQERFGAEYSNYRAATGRLIPRLARLVAAFRGDEWPSPRFAFGPKRYAREPLDAFQRAMLSWEPLHPYNAVHAIKLPGTCNVPELERAIRATAESIGIGDLHIAPSGRALAYSPTGFVEIIQLIKSVDDEARFREVAAMALNTPFAPGAHFPFRWYVWNSADSRGHWVVMAYQHLVADGLAAEAFLRGVVGRYDLPAIMPSIERQHAVVAARPRVLNLIRRSGVIRSLAAVMRLHRRLRFAHKMPDERGRGDTIGVQSLSLSADAFVDVVGASRAAGIGLNDLLLAALARAIAQATPDRHTSRRRRRIALATMFSTRPVDEQCVAFGAWLADAVVVVERPDAQLDDVLTQIVAELRPWKADRSWAAAVAAMRFGLVRTIWPIFGLPHNRRSYRKVFPICGGVSTTRPRLTSEFVSHAIERYLRAVPSGPAAPLALAATVHQSSLELVLTHRFSSQSSEQARALLTSIESLLREWCAERRAAQLGSARQAAVQSA